MFGAPYKKNIGKEEEENLLQTTEMSSQPERRGLRLLPLLLIISVFFNILGVSFGLFNLTYKRNSVAIASYESGFSTDLRTYILNSILIKVFYTI